MIFPALCRLILEIVNKIGFTDLYFKKLKLHLHSEM